MQQSRLGGQGLIRPFRPLQSVHEEADSRMFLRAHNALQDHDRVVIQSPDTDVAVLATRFFNSLACKQLRFRTGVKDKLHFIPIQPGGKSWFRYLCFPSMVYALTGCDSQSGLHGIGKKN